MGPPEKTIPQLAKIVADERPPKVIAVGDAVSLGMRRFGMDASLYIVDRKTMRTDIDGTISGLEEIVVWNPPGVVTEEAYEALRRILEETEPRVVRVDGEEDLLALPLIILAPVGSIITYGQPHVGLVVVRVTPESKNEIRELLDAMRFSESGKG